MFEGIKNFFSSAWEKTKDIAGDVWEKTKDISGQVWEKTKEISGNVWDKTKDIAGTIGNGVKSAFGGAAEQTQQTLANAAESTKSAVENLTDASKDLAQSVGESVSESVSSSVEAVAGVGASVGEAIGESVSEGVENVTSGVESLAESMGDVTEGVTESVSESVGELINEPMGMGIEDLTSNVKDLSNYPEGLMESVSESVSEAIDEPVGIGVDDLTSNVKDLSDYPMGLADNVGESIGEQWVTLDNGVSSPIPRGINPAYQPSTVIPRETNAAERPSTVIHGEINGEEIIDNGVDVEEVLHGQGVESEPLISPAAIRTAHDAELAKIKQMYDQPLENRVDALKSPAVPQDMQAKIDAELAKVQKIDAQQLEKQAQETKDSVKTKEAPREARSNAADMPENMTLESNEAVTISILGVKITLPAEMAAEIKNMDVEDAVELLQAYRESKAVQNVDFRNYINNPKVVGDKLVFSLDYCGRQVVQLSNSQLAAIKSGAAKPIDIANIYLNKEFSKVQGEMARSAAELEGKLTSGKGIASGFFEQSMEETRSASVGIGR